MNEPIAVLGGGNVGHTIAADFSLGGYKVNFYEHPQFEDAFGTTLEKGIVEIENQIAGRCERARIHKVTTDMEGAIRDVKLIVVAIPSFGQELFFHSMIPYLKDGQAVFLMTGNFGSLRLRKLLREKTPDHKITIGETSLTPCGTRLTGPAKVSVLFGFGPWLGSSLKAGQHESFYLVSTLPSVNADEALKELLELYPRYRPVKNVLISGLNNINTFSHPAASLLNAGRIEYANLYSKCEFRLHREGHTPSVQRVEAGIIDEAAAIVRALGSEVTMPRTAPKEFFDHCQTHPTSIGPRTLKDRYITEDVPYGLLPMSQLGEKFGVATPLMNAVIEIASVMNQEDYRKTGRTLESLGLAQLSKEQITKFVEEEI